MIETRSARDSRRLELKKAEAELTKSVEAANKAKTKLEEQGKALQQLVDKHKDVPELGRAAEHLKKLPENVNGASAKQDVATALGALEAAASAAEKELTKVTAPPELVSEKKTIENELKEVQKPLADAKKKLEELDLAALTTAVMSAEAAYDAATDEYMKTSKPSKTLAGRLWPSRRLRCLTAYCFGGDDGTKYGIEPVLDLPFGIVWSSAGGALRSYVNSHSFNIEFNAGLRYWFAYDTASLMVYISRPVIESKDPIQVAGSAFQHDPAAIRRPYPSFGVGLFGDVLLLGVSLDELRNGTTAQSQDPKYPANSVISRSLTFSLGFSIVNTARNSADAAMAKKDKGGK